jgi:hypothetical protein
MKYVIGAITVSVMFSGCMTMSGYYHVDAYNSSGELLNKNLKMTVQGSSIYATRNGLCSAFPKATVVIRDTKTGEQLLGESPYQCR